MNTWAYKIIFLFLLAISGIINQTYAQSGWKTFKHPTYKYTISYPADWASDNMAAFVIFSRPKEEDEDGQPIENVNVAVENRKEEPITLEKLATEYSEQVKQLMGPKGLLKQSKTTVSGLPAVKFDELFEAPEGKLHINQYVVIKNNMAYLFTFTAQQSTYPKYQPTAMKIINSFKLPK